MPPGRQLAPLDPALVKRLHRQAGADRWNVSLEQFAEALDGSVIRAFESTTPPARDVERYLAALHVSDVALACACAAGDEAAWEHFIREHRPLLYRAADAIAPGGSAREIADSLYAELYGLQEREGKRRSLFAYYHGRSSLATWLRAVLAQRHVDRIRVQKRVDPLPDDEPAVLPSADPDRQRFAALMVRAMGSALASLVPRDRLRIRCYYAQQLTLAETGRLLNEHEATVSRQLARTRRLIREDIEQQLRGEARLSEEEIIACFRSAAADAGPFDLGAALAAADGRKDSAADRST